MKKHARTNIAIPFCQFPSDCLTRDWGGESELGDGGGGGGGGGEGGRGTTIGKHV